ncbi:hypothetical protein EY650_06115 [Enterococcus faecalis]|uniref:Uncharacterized protein n=1 Tax=Streptococcus thermophilus TaxID=1308 RepID=A0A2H5CQ67_STRTR|nr:hypothetical protein EF62_pA0007 [Enterococcus faecalis 62]AUH26703.1 hypothetical protein [Streptococcus thermophilus]AXG90126.1 hypothetical protein DTO64_16170 [Enterococcus faecalis]EAH8259313.1 hypothetical protein [Campylobacter jejuni]EJU94578.1 hypothetical protein HMPREF1327_00006 [Enterococcus faecalis 599]MCT0476004.1 hypothetical protein [Lactococcus cremoris]TKL02556.1 hypothetical protein DVV94_16335 [Enterococcus faecium]HAU5581783.1 hypothetical protein [Proteus mirabilis]
MRSAEGCRLVLERSAFRLPNLALSRLPTVKLSISAKAETPNFPPSENRLNNDCLKLVNVLAFC